MPLGYNRNSIKVNSNDFSSVIAFVMSSNNYLEGLVTINYMGLNNSVSRSGQGSDVKKKDIDQHVNKN